MKLLIATRGGSSFAARNNKTATPSPAAISLTGIAPTVTTTGSRTVVPGTASLTLTRYAPTVTSSGSRTATPSVANLTATGLPPTVTTSGNLIATPSRVVLTLTRFAPTITAVAGQIRYISPTGSDSTGTGSSANPWATINKWVGTVSGGGAPQAGDTLYVRGGTYSAAAVCYIGRHDSGVDTNDLLGTSGAPITIAAYPTETPVFSGGTGTLLSIATATYLVLDGIQIQSRPGTQSGHITTGQWPAAGPWGPADNITIRNCKFTLAAGEGDSGYHPIYATAGTHDLIVEDNVFLGPNNNTPNDGGYGCQVYEGFRDAPLNSTIRRNVFVGWNVGGTTIFGGSETPAPTGSILHNTFVNCRINVRLNSHGAVTVRDNAGEQAWGDSSYNILNDGTGSLTQDHNYWGITIGSAPGYAVSGAAIGGASDGSDAGA